MKHLFLIASLMIAISAHAGETLVADLNTFAMDRNLNSANSGFVTVTNFGKHSSIRLVLENRCIATNAEPVCLMGIETALDLTLKLVDVKKDSCGAVIYRAVSDQRVADFSQVITVTDNRNNICESIAAMTPTIVNYDLFGFAGHYSASVMTGKALTGVEIEGKSVKTDKLPMSY